MYRRTSFYFVGRFLLPGVWGAAAFVWFAQNGGLPHGLTSLTAMPHYLNIVLPVGIVGLVVAATFRFAGSVRWPFSNDSL